MKKLNISRKTQKKTLSSKKGGMVYGTGATASIVDLSELNNINQLVFFDEYDEEFDQPWQQLIIKMAEEKKILFKQISQELLTNSSKRGKINPYAEIDNMKQVIKMGIATCCFVVPSLSRSVVSALVRYNDGTKQTMLVMERYDMSLDKYISTYKKTISPLFTLKVARYLLETLHVLHEHDRFHFDIKPENIMVKLKPFTLMLTDYGVMMGLDDFRNAGTPEYMSPLNVLRFECRTEDVYCENVKKTYADLKEFYRSTIYDVDDVLYACKEGRVADAQEFCRNRGESTRNFSCKMAQRRSKKMGTDFANKVSVALANICEDVSVPLPQRNEDCSDNIEVNPASRRASQVPVSNDQVDVSTHLQDLMGVNTKMCDHVEFLMKELKRVINQKDELYAVGKTLQYLQKRLFGIVHDEKLFEMFIDKILKARLFDGYPYAEDFFSCEEALEFLDTHFSRVWDRSFDRGVSTM